MLSSVMYEGILFMSRKDNPLLGGNITERENAGDKEM
jgi:hypothetical protein